MSAPVVSISHQHGGKHQPLFGAQRPGTEAPVALQISGGLDDLLHQSVAVNIKIDQGRKGGKFIVLPAVLLPVSREGVIKIHHLIAAGLHISVRKRQHL